MTLRLAGSCHTTWLAFGAAFGVSLPTSTRTGLARRSAEHGGSIGKPKLTKCPTENDLQYESLGSRICARFCTKRGEKRYYYVHFVHAMEPTSIS